jgi:hypothetical protein
LFLEPLEKQSVKSVNLSADDVRLLFSSIKTIHALHSTFLVDLELELQSPNHVKLGKMFIELVPPLSSARSCARRASPLLTCRCGVVCVICVVQAEWLKMYSTYINNYDNAMQILMRLKEKSSWVAFENATRQNPECRMLRLEDFLIQARRPPPSQPHIHATSC